MESYLPHDHEKHRSKDVSQPSQSAKPVPPSNLAFSSVFGKIFQFNEESLQKSVSEEKKAFRKSISSPSASSQGRSLDLVESFDLEVASFTQSPSPKPAGTSLPNFIQNALVFQENDDDIDLNYRLPDFEDLCGEGINFLQKKYLTRDSKIKVNEVKQEPDKSRLIAPCSQLRSSLFPRKRPYLTSLNTVARGRVLLPDCRIPVSPSKRVNLDEVNKRLKLFDQTFPASLKPSADTRVVMRLSDFEELHVSDTAYQAAVEQLKVKQASIPGNPSPLCTLTFSHTQIAEQIILNGSPHRLQSVSRMSESKSVSNSNRDMKIHT